MEYLSAKYDADTLACDYAAGDGKVHRSHC